MMRSLILEFDRFLEPPPAEVGEQPPWPEPTPLTQGPEEPQAPEGEAAGGRAKVHKISRSLRALLSENTQEMPTLKPLLRALDTCPQDLAVVLEKAEKLEQKKGELPAEEPAAPVPSAEQSPEELDRMREGDPPVTPADTEPR